jgi:hypothetical protein
MRVPLLIFGVTAVLFSTVAITNVPVNGWFRGTPKVMDSNSAEDPSPESSAAERSIVPTGAGEIHLKSRCGNCGVVESTRRLAAVGALPAIYETRIRLGDGSTFVLSDAAPVNMHPGERIRIIGGNDRSVR